MDDKNSFYINDIRSLKEIAENFKNEVLRFYALTEEIEFNIRGIENITKQDIEMFYEMALVYLIRYLELFNRDFFIAFFVLRPHIMLKPQHNKKDQEKLLLSYDNILETYIRGDPDDLIAKIMTERFYNEIFSYEKMPFNIFIKKLLDDYLELNFTNECKNRNLEFGDTLQNYKKYRNLIVHGNERLKFKGNKFSVSELNHLILEYIRLVEELIYPKYFKKPEIPHSDKVLKL